jgi:hypothetical protein
MATLLWLSGRTPSPPCGVGIRNERGGSAGPGSACARFTCSPILSHPRAHGCSSRVTRVCVCLSPGVGSDFIFLWGVGFVEGATELDAMDGGRRVTRADVKAWLKNRCLLLLLSSCQMTWLRARRPPITDRHRMTYKLAARSSAHLSSPLTKVQSRYMLMSLGWGCRHHANRRRSGQEPNMSLHAKLRKGQHGEFKRPRLASPGPSQDHQGTSVYPPSVCLLCAPTSSASRLE